MNTYTIRYNRRTNHIAGLQIRSTGSEMDYARSACSALSRNATQFANGKSFDTVADALAAARTNARVTGRKLCTTCEQAALAS